MKIYVLIDDLPADETLSVKPIASLEPEHGLSLWIQTGKSRVLCDMGASGRFIDNADKMGADLSRTDLAFVSHGHDDHCGGLPAWLSRFPGIDTYISDQALIHEYFSSRHQPKKNISPDVEQIRKYSDVLIPVSESRWVTEDIALVRNECSDFAKPYGNVFLTRRDAAEEVLDDFTHEISLAVKTDHGLVIISSCSHNGAVNIMESCCRFTGTDRVYAFVGGLHFVNGDSVGHEVDTFRSDLMRTFPGTLIYTGHCTGAMARERLAAILDDVAFFRTGTVIEL